MHSLHKTSQQVPLAGIMLGLPQQAYCIGATGRYRLHAQSKRALDSARPLKSFTLMEPQYAYQRSRSTVAALHHLVQKIEGSLNQREFALGVFLDIDGAFDNASFGSMDAASMGFF
jgi:hypothetical protein